MRNRHEYNLEKLTAHLSDAKSSESPLSSAAYVAEVSRHLMRIRRQPPSTIIRRV